MSTQHFEQQLSLYTDIKIYCAIAALIFLTAAIVLFFVFKIPSVFAELTGKKAEQAVRQMTEDNSVSGFLKAEENVPGSEKTEVLWSCKEDTEVLVSDEKLSDKESTGNSRQSKGGHRFVIEKSMRDIHTDQVIGHEEK